MPRKIACKYRVSTEPKRFLISREETLVPIVPQFARNRQLAGDQQCQWHFRRRVSTLMRGGAPDTRKPAIKGGQTSCLNRFSNQQVTYTDELSSRRETSRRGYYYRYLRRAAIIPSASFLAENASRRRILTARDSRFVPNALPPSKFLNNPTKDKYIRAKCVSKNGSKTHDASSCKNKIQIGA